MRRTTLILIFGIQSAFGFAQTPAPSVRLHFPPENGVVYGRPHVLVIFDIDGTFETVLMRLDGREIPKSVFTFCPICAGNHTAILTSDVPWGAVAGTHVLTVEARDEKGAKVSIARHYTVDSSRPSLSGLSGHILFPDAFAATGGTAIAGGSWLDRQPRAEGFGGIALGGKIPVEAVGAESGFSWKAQLLELPPIWSFAAGQIRGHSFGAISYRTETPHLELTLGATSGSAWLGGSIIVTDLNRRGKVKGSLADALAVSELITFEGEIDDRGRVNFGAVLLHPYGWSIGLYRVNSVQNGTWRMSATYRFAVR